MGRIKRQSRIGQAKKKVQHIRNAQPMLYYGIQFKSKLELYTYKKLKEANIKFSYEEHKFELLPKFIYQGKSMELLTRKGVKTFDWQSENVRGITYLPDFVDLRGKWVIECKGYPNLAFPLKWKMFKQYMNENHPGFTLYMPRNQKQVDIAIQHIKDNGKSRTIRRSTKRSTRLIQEKKR